MNTRHLLVGMAATILIAQLGCSFQSKESSADNRPRKARVVTVAQSAPADFVGADNVVLQKAADSLRPGDTLEIGPVPTRWTTAYSSLRVSLFAGRRDRPSFERVPGSRACWPKMATMAKARASRGRAAEVPAWHGHQRH